MKKRVLLSLVSFFMMTTMWASLIEAYKISVTADANGVTGKTATLTLNMDNRTAIVSWKCDLVLPDGVTFVSAELLNARVPEGYEPEFTFVDNGNGTISFNCEGADGVALEGTAGAVATVTVAVAEDATVGDVILNVKGSALTDANGKTYNRADNEYTWTIEQGEVGVTGDLNGDGSVSIADAVVVLEIMASNGYDAKADLNQDGIISIADFVVVLELMASQPQ